jgi:hypothetical protein
MSRSSTTFYHSTTPDRVASILQNGLKINSATNHTEGGSWADKYYGGRPIYLSTSPGKYQGTQLSVNVSGQQLYADLPSLVDYGAYVEEDGTIWWESPPQGLPDGEYHVSEILDDAQLSRACIELTGTCAILNDILPAAISLYE